MSNVLNAIGIESLFGPSWDFDLAVICQLTGQQNDLCLALKAIEVYSPTNPFGTRELGVKAGLHLLQNIIEQRFAEYDENFSTLDFFRAPLIDLSTIPDGIDTAWLFRNQDTLCPSASELTVVGDFSNDTNTVFLDGTHGDSAGAQDAAFLAALDQLLLDTVEDIPADICAGKFRW